MASFTKVVSDLVYFYCNVEIKGYRKSDQFPVAIKQVPRSRVGKMVQIGERRIPNEFYMHLMATKCEGVVQVENLNSLRYTYLIRCLIGLNAGQVM